MSVLSCTLLCGFFCIESAFLRIYDKEASPKKAAQEAFIAISGTNLVTPSHSTSSRALSDHFDGKQFYNPTLPRDFLPAFSSVFKMLREGRSRWPAFVANKGVPELHQKLAPGWVAVTFVNHATFLLQASGLNILTDPVWSDRASPSQWIGQKRVRKPGIPFDQLPRIDLILI